MAKSVDSGWQSTGIDNVVPIVVAPSSADTDLVYAGYLDMGLWRSDNGGDSWVDLNTPDYSGGWLGFGGNSLTVLPDPDVADVVWAQTGGNMENCYSVSNCAEPRYLLKSTDRGESWKQHSNDLPTPLKRLESLSIAPDSDINYRWLYAVANGDVYLSQNGGDNWSRVMDCGGTCYKTWYVEDFGVFAISSNQLYISWQGGVANSWSLFPMDAAITANLPSDAHWLHSGWAFQGIHDAAFDAATDSIWLAVYGSGKGLYHFSYSNGATWQKVIDDPYARSVTRDLQTGEVLFGSSSAAIAGGYNADSGGLRISQNGIDNWQSSNKGMVYPFVTHVTSLNPDQRWLISPGQGILKSR